MAEVAAEQNSQQAKDPDVEQRQRSADTKPVGVQPSAAQTSTGVSEARDEVEAEVEVEGRIFFAGNPWPLGHRVVSCTFNASIRPGVGAYAAGYPNPGPGLMLEFELTTAPYDEEDASDRDAEAEGEGESDWTSKIAWNNYGSACIGPSQSSQVQGVRVSDGSSPFAFDLPEYRFVVDTLPVNKDTFHETAGFGIYLLGHDSVANHDIRLQIGRAHV